MTTSSNPIPPGFHTLTPQLIIKNAAEAIEFYKKAFGAEELTRMPMPDGRLIHACLRIGDSNFMLCDEFPEHCGGLSPLSLKSAHASIHIYVHDVDQAFQRAIDAGAKAEMPPQDMFWGDRYGRLVDPFGQPWTIATHKEDLTHEEMFARMQQGCAPAQEIAKAEKEACKA